MDEISLKRTVYKGQQAQKVIDSHKEFWSEIESDLWRMWANSKSEDKDGREDLYREHHAIKAVQARLKRVVDQGKRAEEELRHQKVKDGE